MKINPLITLSLLAAAAITSIVLCIIATYRIITYIGTGNLPRGNWATTLIFLAFQAMALNLAGAVFNNYTNYTELP